MKKLPVTGAFAKEFILFRALAKEALGNGVLTAQFAHNEFFYAKFVSFGEGG